MPLEYLRILAETAKHLRSNPEQSWARERRDEWLGYSLEHHSPRAVADAAGLTSQELGAIIDELRPPARGSSYLGRWLRRHLDLTR